MRLFPWLLDCSASLAMTGRVQRRPLPVIARRSCAVAIQSFSVRRPKEAVFGQCAGHLFLFRSICDEAIQSSAYKRLDCFALPAMTDGRSCQCGRRLPTKALPAEPFRLARQFDALDPLELDGARLDQVVEIA